jgi:hypothetical protein
MKLSALFITSCAVALLCIEPLVRISGMDPPMLWRPHPVRGWEHIPGAEAHWTEEGNGWVRVNALGMRDVERTVARRANVLRIAVFGDSMTEGVQVNLDQTFTQQLERRLNTRGVASEVLNFGASGYSALQGYLTFREVGKRFQPDLVLHAVFIDNDVAGSDPALAVGQVGAPFVVADTSSALRIDYSPAEQSFAEYQAQPIHAIRNISATYRTITAMRRRMAGRDTQVSRDEIPRRYLLYRTPPLNEWESAWGVLDRVLVQFQREAISAGSQFAVISVPAGQVVDDKVWEDVLHDYPAMQRYQWDLDAPEERLRRISVRHGISLVQPLAKFRSHVADTPLFFNGIGHFTAAGHRLLAEVIDEYLQASDTTS